MSIQPEQLKRVRFDELAVFSEVASSGSIAAAARRLGVPKSTVGRAITRVEQDLGTTLVRRMARGPSLTEAGRLLANLAAPHIAALRDLSSSLLRDASEPYGTLRITAPPDIGTIVLAPLLAGFTQRYPRVRVEVDLDMRISDLVREGFDLAIRVSNGRGLRSSSLVAQRLARLHLGLYAGASYLAQREPPRRPEDLAGHEHVLFNARDGKAQLTFEGPKGAFKLSVRGRSTANDFFFLREAIAAGAGVGPLPWFVARPEVASGRLVRVLHEHRLASVAAYLVHPPTTTPSPKLAAFRAYLLEQGPALLLHP
ncbi:MAG: hypothetical protein RLZZ450_4948 [Pseudomonadota bacterium]|jgi:DNA-binding transcriptional LysR family regulator